MFDNTEDDDREGFYEEFPPEEPKKPKEPKYTPDDPHYWEGEGSDWEHLVPASRRSRFMLWGGAGLGLLLILGIAIWWFGGTYVSDAVQYGYVDHVENRGNVFKTYEGNLLPYKSLHDTTRTYEGDFIFSAPGSIGKTIAAFQRSGRPLRVEYRTYRYALPWRGDSRTVIVRVDTVSPDSIMPASR